MVVVTAVPWCGVFECVPATIRTAIKTATTATAANGAARRRGRWLIASMSRSCRRTALAEGSGSTAESSKREGSSPRGTGAGTGGGATGRPGSVSLTLEDTLNVEAG